MDTPCSACTESVMCTSRPRYRPLECIVPVYSHSYVYMLDMRQLGGTTESIMAFSSQRGMERFFYCPVIKEEQTMSVEVELEESVSYTPLQRMRHSAAHVMAEAVLEIFPDAKLAIGPAIEDGFYYDFDLPRALTPDDLPEIERRMTRIIAGKYPFLQERWPREKALQYFRDRGQIYKVELIENLPDEEVGIYRQHNFLDLCRGPHVEPTGQIGPFKLMKIAGAYWLPKGFKMLLELINFWRSEHEKRGYQEISAPLINDRKIWEISGHWEHYREEMFLIPVDENVTYGVKPMNCPNAMIVYNLKTRSYRDLPLRLSDCDTLHRHERAGTLHGLLRAQKFQQDDAHIFVMEEQIEEEYDRILELTGRFYSIFDLKYSFRLGTRPESYIGDLETWYKAEAALQRILDKHV